MTGLPFRLIRLLASFQRDPSTYFLYYDSYKPPALLLQQI